MHDAGKTAAMLALASVCCGAWAKALTFEEIERADTVSGRYINHLSATEMNAATTLLGIAGRPKARSFPTSACGGEVSSLWLIAPPHRTHPLSINGTSHGGSPCRLSAR